MHPRSPTKMAWVTGTQWVSDTLDPVHSCILCTLARNLQLIKITIVPPGDFLFVRTQKYNYQEAADMNSLLLLMHIESSVHDGI